MIVKVQRSISRYGGRGQPLPPTVLVYDETREIHVEFEESEVPGAEALPLRSFWRAEIDDDGLLHLVEPVGEQDW